MLESNPGSIPDEQIRIKAYEFWQRAGMPDGQEDRFWRMAEVACADTPVADLTLREKLAGYDYSSIKSLQIRDANFSYELSKLEKTLTLGAHGDRPEVLWYYTTGDTMIRMLTGGEIWSTQAECLNDSLEIRHGLSLMRDVLSLRDKPAEGTEERAFYNHLMDKLAGNPQLYSNCFVACFSDSWDDLSQWRGYAGGENGFAVGFDSASLVEKAELRQRPRLIKVSYNDIENRMKCRHILDLTFYMLKRGLDVYSARQFPLDIWIDAIYSMFDAHALPWIASMKHRAFSSEKEWRLILNVVGDNGLKYLQKSTMMTRHIPIRFPKMGENSSLVPAKKIYVGPSRHPETSARSVCSLLNQHGYVRARLGWSVDVLISDIPFQVP